MNGTANNTVGSPSRTSLVNETSSTTTTDGGCGGSTNNNHASSSSLMESEDMDGRDNPAFETDDPGGSLGKKKQQNGKSPSVVNNGRNDGDVEMVPLNPNVASQQNNSNGNGTTATTTTTTTTTNKDQKVALDTMYSDYFRPVNTRRKLLRGEKLYVTRDQRAHSRGWKWIAFWGGVFTFVAAALLTGILAATGIIMSKSEPIFGSSHSTLVGNGNHSSENDTYVHDHDFFNQDSNRNDVITTTEHLTTTSSTESPQIPIQVDFGNSLDDNSWTTTTTSSTDGHHEQIHTSTDHIVHWLNHLNITGNDLGVETTTTTTTTTERPDLSSDSVPSENIDDAVASLNNISNVINDRGRSLDEAVTVVPMEDETTLFPTLKNIDGFEDDLDSKDIVSSTVATNVTETTASSQTISFDNDNLDSPLWSLSNNNTDGVLNFENEKHHESSTEENLSLDDTNTTTFIENEKHESSTEENLSFDNTNTTIVIENEKHRETTTEGNLLLSNQTNSTVAEHEENLGNETIEETTNGTSIDPRNSVVSRDNGTELLEPDDDINQGMNITTSSEVASNETTNVILPSTEATTATTTTVTVQDTTSTQVSNLSLTPTSDMEMDDLFNETNIPLNVSLNTTTSEADFNETITSRNINDTLSLVSNDVLDDEEDELLNNSTISSSLANTTPTKEFFTNATMSATNETTTMTMNALNETNVTPIVDSEVTTTNNNATRDELLNAVETTPSSVETTEELQTSSAVVETESSNLNATTMNSTIMVTENSTTSLAEEENEYANMAEI